ncbi:hypothetical protein Dimus_010879, partial [Dionaea muscipula]
MPCPCRHGPLDTLNSDASESEDHSDDSSPDCIPVHLQPHERAHAYLFEGMNSSLSNPFCSPSASGLNAEQFDWAEDPAHGEASTVRHELEMMRLDRDKLQQELEQSRREAKQS